MPRRSLYYVARGHHGQESSSRVVLPFAMLDDLYLQIFQSVRKDEIGKVIGVLAL